MHSSLLGLGRGNKHLLSLFWPFSVHGLPVPCGGETSAAFIDVSMLSSWLTFLSSLRGERNANVGPLHLLLFVEMNYKVDSLTNM
ncbi:hypothetical protein GGI35DRAFT_346171 [Trichoderma velutinum]